MGSKTNTSERLRALLAYVIRPAPRSRVDRCRHPLLPCPLQWMAGKNDTTIGDIPHIDQIVKSIALPSEQAIDPGPQKGPASVAQIQAQTRHLRERLNLEAKLRAEGR